MVKQGDEFEGQPLEWHREFVRETVVLSVVLGGEHQENAIEIMAQTLHRVSQAKVILRSLGFEGTILDMAQGVEKRFIDKTKKYPSLWLIWTTYLDDRTESGERLELSGVCTSQELAEEYIRALAARRKHEPEHRIKKSWLEERAGNHLFNSGLPVDITARLRRP